MYPILTRTEYGFIYTFTAVWMLGLLLMFGYLWWQTRDNQSWWPAWLDGLILIGLAAIVLGRGQFVFQNGAYFAENLDERWDIAAGGIGYWGAVCAVLIGLALFARFRPATWRFLGPYIGLMTIWLHLTGWIACYFEGCAYGRETVIAWSSADLPDTFGVFAVRYQTQLAGILIFLLIFLAIVVVRRLGQNGRHAGWWLVPLSLLIQIAMIPYRGDEMPRYFEAGLRLDLLLGMALFMLACTLGFGIHTRRED